MVIMQILDEKDPRATRNIFGYYNYGPGNENVVITDNYIDEVGRRHDTHPDYLRPGYRKYITGGLQSDIRLLRELAYGIRMGKIPAKEWPAAAVGMGLFAAKYMSPIKPQKMSQVIGEDDILPSNDFDNLWKDVYEEASGMEVDAKKLARQRMDGDIILATHKRRKLEASSKGSHNKTKYKERMLTKRYATRKRKAPNFRYRATPTRWKRNAFRDTIGRYKQYLRVPKRFRGKGY